MGKPTGNKKKGSKQKKDTLVKQRTRYATMKQDPVLYEEIQLKEKERYKQRKKQGKIESINVKSPREQREQRKKWREAAKRYRDKKKNEKHDQQVPLEVVMIHHDNSDETITPNEHENALSMPAKENCMCSAQVKKMKYLEQKKRKHLLKIIMDLKIENKQLKQNLYRQKRKGSEETKEKRDVKKGITKAKHRISAERRIDRLIRDFYEDDANSTIGAGKKQYITRLKNQKQKRYLRDSIKNLHTKFLETHTNKVSYSTFSKCRPFWVLPATSAQRDTCMCTIHANIDLKLESLFKAGITNEKKHQELLESLCCSRYEEKCLSRKCDACQNKCLHYKEFSNDQTIVCYKWIRSRQTIPTKNGHKTVTVTSKQEIHENPLEITNQLNSDLKSFFEHCHRIQAQYNTIKNLKESLTVNSAVIHIDFSENYGMKATNEVQSLHFGGSRKELCLHTAIVYAFDFQSSDIKPTSFCTVSQCLQHDATAVWAHLIPVINKAIENNPHLDTLHFQSDSPTSQYRNKYMFYIITQLVNDFPQIVSITWNYTEAGHGKGAADGVGAVIKRTADFAVNHGMDITTIDKFIQVVRARTNVTVIAISETDVEYRKTMIPDKLDFFKGTLKVHQVLWERDCNKVTFRTLSCFKCICGEICDHGNHLGFIQTVTKNISVLSDVTNLPTTSKIVVAGPSNIKILSNKVIKKQYL